MAATRPGDSAALPLPAHGSRLSQCATLRCMALTPRPAVTSTDSKSPALFLLVRTLVISLQPLASSPHLRSIIQSHLRLPLSMATCPWVLRGRTRTPRTTCSSSVAWLRSSARPAAGPQPRASTGCICRALSWRCPLKCCLGSHDLLLMGPQSISCQTSPSGSSLKGSPAPGVPEQQLPGHGPQ